jgi:hypothetical protein
METDKNISPQFPQYVPPPPPDPVQPGIPFVDQKFHKPLYKLMKNMLKGKVKRPSKADVHIKRKKLKFY